MKKENINKQIFNPLGTIVGIAVTAYANISYNIGDAKAKAFYDLRDIHNNSLASGEIELSTDGWGVDDNVMVNRLWESIGV